MTHFDQYAGVGPICQNGLRAILVPNHRANQKYVPIMDIYQVWSPRTLKLKVLTILDPIFMF